MISKSYLFLLIATVVCGQLYGQETADAAQAARQAVTDGDYRQAYEQAQRWMFLEPESAEAIFYGAFAQLMQGNAQNALQIFQWCSMAEPDWWGAPAAAGYVLALEGRTEEAKKNFLQAFQLLGSKPREEVMTDFAEAVKANGKPGLEKSFSAWWKNPGEATAIPTLLEFNRQAAGKENDPAALTALGKSFADRYQSIGRHDLALNLYAELTYLLGNAGRLSEALAAANQGYLYLRQHGDFDNPYAAARLLSRLLEILKAVENDEEALQHGDELFRLSARMRVHNWDILCMLMLSGAAYSIDASECMKWAVNAYALAEKSPASIHQYEASLAMSVAYSLQPASDAAGKSAEFARSAAQFAVQNKMERQVPEVLSVLGLRMFALRTRDFMEQGIGMMVRSAAIFEKGERFKEAADAYNNLGVIYYDMESYAEAIGYFRKASDVSRKYLATINADPEERLTIYRQESNIQMWLVACHARLGQAAEAFQAMEKSRANVLRQRTGSSPDPITLEDFQQQLAKDEAAVFYDKFSGHEVSILTITRDHAAVIFHSDDTFIGDIKDKYFDRMKKEHEGRRGTEILEPIDRDRRVTHQDFTKVLQLTRRYFEQPGTGDAFLEEFLQGYYRFLILPVANRLVGYKRLILSPNGEYNLIPFEALRTGDGRYLVEKFDVRYTPSATLLQTLRNRNYPGTRDPLLGMGGAKFSAMETAAEPLNSTEDLTRLRIMVGENSRTGSSQRRAYAALFGTTPMPYLPGTVEEVRSIAKLVPGAKTFVGDDMTEARLKEMARSGELGRFRVLHLATHGFVIDDVPELSGVAMSIGAREDKGEDGFLTASEVAALGLKTDLTVLSACQTALGKIYEGEGVTGLTQSLLIAGSKAAVVSLWPVNDNSTMLFMTGLYQEAAKGKTYAAVAADLKRRFIRGEFGEKYKHPNFWAPFVYIGN